jgi:hypothetical protein
MALSTVALSVPTAPLLAEVEARVEEKLPDVTALVNLSLKMPYN